MVNYYNIDKDAHYFALMRPVHTVLGLVSYTSTTDKEKWVECVVDEERYKVDDGYKITLRALDENYGIQHYYQCDFMSLMESGQHIIKKTSPTQHVELISTKTPLTDTTYLVYEGWAIVD